jgi:hypothetical protein
MSRKTDEISEKAQKSQESVKQFSRVLQIPNA